METNKANLILDYLRTDSVRYIILALVIICLFYFFKTQLNGLRRIKTEPKNEKTIEIS